MQTLSYLPFILYVYTMLISPSALEILYHSTAGSRKKWFTPEFARQEACISFQLCVGQDVWPWTTPSTTRCFDSPLTKGLTSALSCKPETEVSCALNARRSYGFRSCWNCSADEQNSKSSCFLRSRLLLAPDPRWPEIPRPFPANKNCPNRG